MRKDKFANGKSPRGPKGADGRTRDDGKPPRGFARPEHILPDPWREPIAVDQIPATGVARTIVADANERAAIAEIGGLRAVYSARADLTLQPMRDGHVQVFGCVTARIGQVCVVSLDDIDSEIDHEIDMVFAPPSKIPTLASTIDDSIDDDSKVPDPPEPIADGVIDIGRVATDALFLAIDPYPRKPGAMLDLPVEDADPDEHPFAALRALKDDGKGDA